MIQRLPTCLRSQGPSLGGSSEASAVPGDLPCVSSATVPQAAVETSTHPIRVPPSSPRAKTGGRGRRTAASVHADARWSVVCAPSRGCQGLAGGLLFDLS